MEDPFDFLGSDSAPKYTDLSQVKREKEAAMSAFVAESEPSVCAEEEANVQSEAQADTSARSESQDREEDGPMASKENIGVPANEFVRSPSSLKVGIRVLYGQHLYFFGLIVEYHSDKKARRRCALQVVRSIQAA